MSISLVRGKAHPGASYVHMTTSPRLKSPLSKKVQGKVLRGSLARIAEGVFMAEESGIRVAMRFGKRIYSTEGEFIRSGI